jgi:serine/threonine protein kinase
MKRPTLDNMTLDSTNSSTSSLPISSPPNGVAVGSSVTVPPRALVAAGSTAPAPSAMHGFADGLSLSGSYLRESQAVNQSYVVSDSGAMLTLGSNYHVSSSGVHEFRQNSMNMGIASTSATGLICNHVSELDFDNGVQIGRGSSGKVFNVLHSPSGVRVCVKQMTVDDSHHRDEVKAELDSLHAASSPWIVDFYGAFFHHDFGVILLVLELMEGSIKDVQESRARLSEMETKALVYQVVHGLSVLHNDRNLIHRDIKPANLLFHRSGQVKITDFGVSRGQRSSDPASVHTFVGSISYMSPERLEGKSYGYECDIWSLGITLCELVTGYHPFQEEFGPDAQQLTFWDLLQRVLNGASDQHATPLSRCIERMRCSGVETVSVSAEMDSFVSECLCYDRNDRASAERLLSHPWLENMTKPLSEEIFGSIATALLLDRSRQQQAAAAPATSAAAANASPSQPSAGGEQSSTSAVLSGQPAPSAFDPSLSSPKSAATPNHPTPDAVRMRSDALMDDLLKSSASKKRL